MAPMIDYFALFSFVGHNPFMRLFIRQDTQPISSRLSVGRGNYEGGQKLYRVKQGL